MICLESSSAPSIDIEGEIIEQDEEENLLLKEHNNNNDQPLAIDDDDDDDGDESHEETELDPCRLDIRFIQQFHRILALSILMECFFCIYTTTLYGPSALIGCIIATTINVLIFFIKSCNFPFIRGEKGLNLLLIFYIINSIIALIDFTFANHFFTTNHGLSGCIKFQLKKGLPQFIGDLEEIDSAKQCTINQEVVWWNCYCYNSIQDSCVVTEAYNGDLSDASEGCDFMVSTIPLLVWTIFMFSLLNGGFYLGTTAYLLVKKRFT